MKPEKAPLLHRVIARRLIEEGDLDGVVPYSKVKYVFRFIFRFPKEHVTSLINEFVNFGLLEKKNIHKMRIGDYVMEGFEVSSKI